MAAANQPSVATPLVGREVRVGEASAMAAVEVRSTMEPKETVGGWEERLNITATKKALPKGRASTQYSIAKKQMMHQAKVQDTHRYRQKIKRAS